MKIKRLIALIIILVFFAKTGSGRKLPKPKVSINPTPSVSATPSLNPSGKITYEPFLL